YGTLSWRHYEHWHYPEFDLCAPGEITRQFSVVVCDQVLEHVVDPNAAACTPRPPTTGGSPKPVSDSCWRPRDSRSCGPRVGGTASVCARTSSPGRRS